MPAAASCWCTGRGATPEEAGTTFSPEVREHLGRHPRRPASLRVETDPQVGDAAWVGTPTTVLLGRHDVLTPEPEQRLAADRVADVRLLDCDHFVLWRDPAAVSRAVLDLLDAEGATSRSRVSGGPP